MLHDVGFGEGYAPARLEIHDGDVEVISRVHRVEEALRGPAVFGSWHTGARYVTLVDDERRGNGCVDPLGIPLPDPVEATDVLAGVPDLPRCARWEIGKCARRQHVSFGPDDQSRSPLGHE
jgi:hypothetical protein